MSNFVKINEVFSKKLIFIYRVVDFVLLKINGEKKETRGVTLVSQIFIINTRK